MFVISTIIPSYIKNVIVPIQVERNIPWDSPIKTHLRIPFYRESGVTLIQHLIEIRPDDSEKVEYYAVLYYHTEASLFFSPEAKKEARTQSGAQMQLKFIGFTISNKPFVYL